MTATLKGLAALLTLSVSTIVLTLFLCLVAILKLVSPTDALRDRIRLWLAGIAELWIGINSAVLGWYRGTRWDIQIPEDLDGAVTSPYTLPLDVPFPMLDVRR